MMLFNSFERLFSRILLIAILIVICLYSTSQAQTNIKFKITSGLEALYNFNFKSSDKSFDNIIKNYPDHPAGYYYKSISHLWFYLDSKNDIDLTNFISLTDTAILKAEEILKNDSSDVFSLYILGSAYANRTFAFTRDESYFDAVIAARKFHSCFDELLTEDSLYYDAYTGKGLFNFAISQAPQTWSWAINLAGMTGDKKIGLTNLEIASKKGKLSKVDAQFYLSQIYSEFLLKYQPAKRMLNDLTFRYPKNLLFKFALANLQAKTFDLSSASRNYKTVYASKDTNFIQLKNYAGMALGDILYYQGDYDDARSYYVKFLEKSTDPHFKGITALKIGLSHLFEGDSLSALMYFDKTDEGNDDLDDDDYAMMKGKLYLNKLPSADELKLIHIKNKIQSGKFNAAIDSLEKFVAQTLSDTLRAEAILSLSDAYFHLGKYKRSLEYAVAVFNFDDYELWVKPFACYYAARASRELKNITDAEFFIGYASNFKNYFYENKLTDRLSFLSFLLTEK
ncbi:MAG TPA: tetratricopeptide repeat protein [Ignavibacteriaceae bacterium]|nr:tetratricopeptide repeat protein [Ignavibacteriaceae bacterium]